MLLSGESGMNLLVWSVADPGFPVGGGRGPHRGHGLPRQLRFVKFVCQNERIWTLGGGRAPGIRQGRSANGGGTKQVIRKMQVATDVYGNRYGF